jgi:prepilin-type N-terminal cleavage/methylation domain-containing protein
MTKSISNRQGFTLIEVLMTIGLLAIISVVSITLIASTSDESKFNATVEHMQQIRDALIGKWEVPALGNAPGIALSTTWAPQSGSLIGIWHLDEASGTTLSDSSGAGNTGTVIGSATLDVPGKIKTALKGANASGWSVPLSLSTITTLSIAAWFDYEGCSDATECLLWEFTSNSTTGTGFSASPHDSSDGAFPSGSFTFGQSNSSGRFVNYTSTPANGWHHLVVVYDRSVAGANTITSYVDGAAIVLTTTTYNHSAGDTFGNSNLYFLGRLGTSLNLISTIDEVAVWTAALSATDVQTIYQKQFQQYAIAQRKSFGYIGDIGALPTAAQGLAALWSNPGLPAWSTNLTARIGLGWNGSYLNQSSLGSDYSKDAWGTPYVYDPTTTPFTLTSYGADRAAGGTGLNSDISINIPTSMTSASIQGVILDKGEQWSGTAQVELNLPDGSGALQQTIVNVVPANNGAFSFTSVPPGVRSASVYIPSKAAAVTTQGPFIFTVDRANSPAILQMNY